MVFLSRLGPSLPKSWVKGVQLLDWRGDKVARERIYVVDAWEAPEWRAPWRSPTTAE